MNRNRFAVRAINLSSHRRGSGNPLSLCHAVGSTLSLLADFSGFWSYERFATQCTATRFLYMFVCSCCVDSGFVFTYCPCLGCFYMRLIHYLQSFPSLACSTAPPRSSNEALLRSRIYSLAASLSSLPAALIIT